MCQIDTFSLVHTTNQLLVYPKLDDINFRSNKSSAYQRFAILMHSSKLLIALKWQPKVRPTLFEVQVLLIAIKLCIHCCHWINTVHIKIINIVFICVVEVTTMLSSASALTGVNFRPNRFLRAKSLVEFDTREQCLCNGYSSFWSLLFCDCFDTDHLTIVHFDCLSFHLTTRG